jgi:hypothetical protein
MMRLLIYVSAVSVVWAILAVTAPEVAKALTMLFVSAIVVPGSIIEIRDAKHRRG